MCLLDENKTEAYLLRVLIEVGRRAKSYPQQRVRIGQLALGENAFHIGPKTLYSYSIEIFLVGVAKRILIDTDRP